MNRSLATCMVRVLIGLSAFVGILVPRCALGQTAGGSILRQLSTANGDLPNITTWESLSLPDSIDDRRASLVDYQSAEPIAPSMPSTLDAGSSDPQWSTPYSMSRGPTLEDEVETEGWYDFLPEGCWPWGPRTPRQYRYLGVCYPLEGTSWRNRPLSAGWAIGALWCEDPLDHRVDLEPGIHGTYRLGWDYDYYWGLEMRLGQATPAAHDREVGTPHTTADVTLFDVSVLWYPTGDSRLRPYVCLGLGFEHFNFRDHNYDVVNTSTFSMPFGLGVKWLCTPWIALRLEATENWAVGNDQLDMMHNFALNAGVEVRFGGPRPSYWPWNPNRVIW